MYNRSRDVRALPPDLLHEENVINIQIIKFKLKIYHILSVTCNKRV